MNFRGCLLIETADQWRLVVGDQTEQLSIDVPPEELPVCAKLMIGLADRHHQTVILAPASTSCFFCLLQPADVVDIRDRQALLYELENHLPIDAESTVADFVPLPAADDQTTVSAAAIDLKRWKGIVDAFESADLPVRSIVPAAVLAARALCRRIDFGATAELYLVDDDCVDVIAVRSETILGWKYLPLQPTAIRRHKVLDPTPIDLAIVAGLDPNDHESVASPEHVTFMPDDRDELIIQGAELLLESSSSRWFELRRDALTAGDPLRAIGRQLRWVAVAAAACLLAISVGGWWRTQRIETEIANLQSQQAELFRKAFPESRVPRAVVRRVRSEHSKVLASRGQNSDIEIPHSATHALRRLLGALPVGLRYRITRIEIRDGQVDLQLQVRSALDAGKIATSISGAGFQVAPPGTRQVDQGTFESNLQAIWVGSTAVTGDAG